MEFRTDINGLRAIAVATVVLFHFNVKHFDGGFIGVDVFFVISGYLMTAILLKDVGKLSSRTFADYLRILLKFYGSRTRKIVPPLAAMCVVLLVFGYVFVDPLSYASMAQNAFRSLLFYSNMSYAAAAGYFGTGATSNFLLHTWSLSVEWQFYMLYPALFLLVWHLFPRHLLLAIGILFVGSLALSVWYTAVRPTFSYFLFPTRAWEMLAGGLVALAPAFSLSARLRSALSLAGLAAIAASVLLFDENTYWPGFWALVPICGSVAVLLANHSGLWSRNPVCHWIGLTSYSIYLWHWPLLCALLYLGYALSPLIVLILLAATMAVSFISYFLVEKPSRHLFRLNRGEANPVRWRDGFAAAGWAIVAVAGLSLGLLHGLPKRAPIADAEAVYASLRGVSGDWQYPKSCGYRQSLLGEGALRLCSTGEAAAAHKVLVFGDSFAEQLYPYFVAHGLQGTRLDFATSGGCPPLPHLERITPGSRCTDLFSRVEALLSKERYDTVVVTSLWTTYFNPKKGSSVRAGDFCFWSAGRCERAEDAAAAEAKIDASFNGLGAFMARLRGQGIKVILALNMPYSAFNMPSEMSKRYFQNADISALKAFPVVAALQDRAYVEGKLRRAADVAKAQVYDPLLDICPAGHCAAVDERMVPLYIDRPHLSGTFLARTQLPILDRLIAPDR